jgi:beta-phosphoglucomutase-like phosphatase (HAD superfamily)
LIFTRLLGRGRSLRSATISPIRASARRSAKGAISCCPLSWTNINAGTVPQLFRFLVGQGKRIALGSSAKAKDFPAYKKAASIEDIPLVELSSDDVERSKPHPDIFNAALSRLGLRPEQVMVVGDTPYDIVAAHKAGLVATAVLCGGFPESNLLDAGA